MNTPTLFWKYFSNPVVVSIPSPISILHFSFFFFFTFNATVTETVFFIMHFCRGYLSREATDKTWYQGSYFAYNFKTTLNVILPFGVEYSPWIINLYCPSMFIVVSSKRFLTIYSTIRFFFNTNTILIYKKFFKLCL